MAQITIMRKWSSGDVREACIKNNFYTRGDNESYKKMLDLVDSTEPTPENLYSVAKDIKEHSEDQSISNVMFCIEKDAVLTFYEVEGEE